MSTPTATTLTISEVGGEYGQCRQSHRRQQRRQLYHQRANGCLGALTPAPSFDDLARRVPPATTSVEYTATDGSQTDTATLTVTVSGANDGLTANADSGQNHGKTQGAVGGQWCHAASPGGTTTMNADLLLNDVDIDGDEPHHQREVGQ